MLPFSKLDLILRRHEEIEARLTADIDSGTFVSLSREMAETDGLVQAIKAHRAGQGELSGLDAMLADPALDAEMREMAAVERGEAAQRLAGLERAIQLALLPKDAADEKGAILEIRAARGATKPRCSRATCSACIRATPTCTAGRSTCCR